MSIPHWSANRTMVCFRHRYTAKVPASQVEGPIERRCPMCGRPLANCGRNFKAPRFKDDKAWKASEEKFLAGGFGR